MDEQMIMLWVGRIACLVVVLAGLVVGFKWTRKCDDLHRWGMLLCGFAIAA